MALFGRTKKIIIKIDDFREERLEVFISNDILKRWNEYKNADDLRKAGTLAVINAVSAYATTYGLPALTDEVKEQIAEENVKVLKALNQKLQKQLNKKSKSYVDRHSAQADS